MKVVFEMPSKGFQFDSFKLPTHISLYLKKSFYLLSWKSLSCIKFQIWNIFSWNSNLCKPLFISWNGRSHIIFTLGFCDEMNLNSLRSIRQRGKSWKVISSLSFNFQKVSNFTQFHTSNHTTIRQTINTIYLI